MRDSFDLCVLGLGRVGLPIALLAADRGMSVAGVDRSAHARALASGAARSPEPGLHALAARVAQTRRLVLCERAAAAPVSVICVGTPLGTDRRADLGDFDAAVCAIDETAPPDGLVVISSTVPVGTTERAAALLRARHPTRLVACCPERVLPGDLLREMVETPRVAGGIDDTSTDAAIAWLQRFVSAPIARTDCRTAELAKLAENAARDVQLALAYTIASLAERFDIDSHVLRDLVNRHPRVALLSPGVGVGGHCLPVDPWFLVADAPERTALLGAAREVNDAVPQRWVAKIASVVSSRPPGRQTIGLLGLTYKPETDDLRHSPALQIARALSARFDVLAHDPFVQSVEGVPMGTLSEVRARDIVVLLVAHSSYADLHSALSHATVIDACGGWR